MPDYPEPQPTRPPSHYLLATRDQGPSWCLNAEMDQASGHQPCTAMVHILHTLVDTGDTWREVTFDEVMKHRGVFDPLEFHFNKVLKYSSESRGVATFCMEWRDVFHWDDSLGRSMKRQILNLKQQTA